MSFTRIHSNISSSVSSLGLLAGALCAPLAYGQTEGVTTTRYSNTDITPCVAVIAAAPTGEVFVGVDKQGSLGREPGLGKVVRLIDKDADGKADEWTDFVKVDNPRGIISLGEKLIVLHTTVKNGKFDTQQISEFVDADGDGVADGPGKPLVKGIGNPAYLQSRGADHCTNNIRLAIDGWIYISVGDFGFVDAEGADGKKLTLHGGGIVRVRPDGSGLETFNTGTRNVYDVAIDPFMNLFTRENTNDGVGWWSRSFHYIQSGNYGYPSLYTNFPEDMLPSLGEYGSGSGVGALYLEEPSWPATYNRQPLLADWGRSTIYVHEVEPNGASFKNKIRPFAKFSQVTDLDIDASGRMYVATWDGSGYKAQKIKGFVERVVPEGWEYEPFPAMKSFQNEELLPLIESESNTKRTYASYELVSRNATEQVDQLAVIAKNTQLSDASRVAAVYTLAQIQGEKAQPILEQLAGDDLLAEHAVRCMADRLEVAKKANVDFLIKALSHSNPRVQVAATVALSRVGDLKAAPVVLANALYSKEDEALAAKERKRSPKVKGYLSPDKINPHSSPNRRIILPHVSQQALVSMNAEDAIIAGVESADQSLFEAALTTAKFMHSEKVVDALIAEASKSSRNAAAQQEIATVLMRLHQKEDSYDGSTWWGTRPKPTGPYYYPVDWQATAKIAEFLKSYIDDAKDQKPLVAALKRNKAYVEPYFARPVIEKTKISKIKDTGIEDVILYLDKYKPRAKNGGKVIKSVGCVSCHNIDQKGVVKAPDLTKLGHVSAADLTESILKPGAAIAASWVNIHLKDGSLHLGTIVSESATEVTLHNIAGMPTTLQVSDIQKREPGLNMMSLHLCDELTLNAFGDMIGYIKSLDPKFVKKGSKKSPKKK